MAPDEHIQIDAAVRLAVYHHVIEHVRAPSVPEIGKTVSAAEGDVVTSLQRLADAHKLVLTPGTSNVWMAMPFSTALTRFAVDTAERSYFANCAWDALGVSVILDCDATVRTACADCGLAVELSVRDGQLDDAHGFVHFAVPVRRWWDDVGYT